MKADSPAFRHMALKEFDRTYVGRSNQNRMNLKKTKLVQGIKLAGLGDTDKAIENEEERKNTLKLK